MAEAKKVTSKQRLLGQVSSLSEDDPPDVAASKKISWILRHGAKKVGLSPDNEGYVEKKKLLEVEMLKDDHTQEVLERIISDSCRGGSQKLRYETKEIKGETWVKTLKKEERKSKDVEVSARPSTGAAVTTMASGGHKLSASATPFEPTQQSSYMQPQYPYGYSPYGYPGYGYGMTPTMSMGHMPSGGASMKMFRGKIKSYFKEKGYGFIDCPQAHAMYGRDVFMYKKEIPDEDKISPGTEVSFNVKMNDQRMPQAIDIELAQGKGKGKGGSKGKAKGEGKKGEGKSKGEGKEKKGGKGGKKEKKEKGGEAKEEEKKEGEEKKEEKKEEAPAA